MNDIAFAPIREVAVGLPDEDNFSTVTTVSGMMGILMSKRWPKRANDTVWQNALATCVRAVRLETDTTKARKAFAAAARDAGLKVLPDEAVGRPGNCAMATAAHEPRKAWPLTSRQ
ncbi:DUF982 domain-containing protein [Rhizobium leguminosarum]